MPSELAVGADARQLVPGDPERLDALAARLSSFAEAMGTAASRLREIERGEWTGAGADAFRRLVGEQPARFEVGASAFSEAAQAVAGYAEVLRQAQSQARHAVARYEEAEARTQAWRWQLDASHAGERAVDAAVPVATSVPTPPPTPPAPDPGEEGRDAARRLLHDARARVRHQAGVASAALGSAAEAAPDEPGLLRQVLDGAGSLLSGFFVDGLGGLVRGVWESADALLDDPGGWVRDTWDTAYDHVAVWNWDTFTSTWIDFGKEFVAWDQWAKDWRRALGQVAFNVAFTVVTAGAGKVVLRLLKRRRLPPARPEPREHHEPHSSSPEENRRHYARPAGAPPYERVHRTNRSNRHILDGETYGRGGHRARTGYPRKTEFPDGWSDDQILDTVDKAAQNPVRATELRMTEASPTHPTGQPQYSYAGEANGLQVRIIVDQNGRVVSAHPLEGQPGTFTNPELPPGLRPEKPVYVRPDPHTGNPGYWVATSADGTTAYFDESGLPIRRPRDVPPTPVPPPGHDDATVGA